MLGISSLFERGLARIPHALQAQLQLGSFRLAEAPVNWSGVGLIWAIR